jgi:hypothetical protein
MNNKQEKKESWMLSENFFKRSLAVSGYAIVGFIIIYLVLITFSFILGLFIGILS